MKNNFALLAALLIAATPFVLHADDLDNARAQFKDREFDKSAVLFEKVSEASPSAGIFYELGRAYDGLGNNARAALSFQRSLLLDPRFAPARAALREAQTKLGIPQPKPRWQTKLAEFVPLDPVSLVATALFWFGAFFFLISIFSDHKKSRVLVSVASLVIAIGLLTSVWLSDPRVAHRDTAMILASGGTTALASPAEQSEKVASLPEGSLITILSQRGRWFFAKLPSGANGWLLTDGVVPVIPNS